MNAHVPVLWPEGDHRLALYRYWEPRVGVYLARRQAEYEFGRKVIRAHKAGASLKDISDHCHVTRERIRQIEAHALRREREAYGDLSPIEFYFSNRFSSVSTRSFEPRASCASSAHRNLASLARLIYLSRGGQRPDGALSGVARVGSA